jgi:methyltransferase family protein
MTARLYDEGEIQRKLEHRGGFSDQAMRELSALRAGAQARQLTLAQVRACLGRLEAELGELRQRAGTHPGAATRLANAVFEINSSLPRIAGQPPAGDADGAAGEIEQAIKTFVAAQGRPTFLPHDRYRFTVDLFSTYVPLWTRLFQPLLGAPRLRFLEVGSFEGMSACWMLDHALTHPTSSLICVDTFQAHPQQEALFDFNIRATGSDHKVTRLKGLSWDVLSHLPGQTFDLVYIDASHLAENVLRDALLCWPLLKRGGYCVFDDYALERMRPELPRSRLTGAAVDAWLSLVEGQYEQIHCGWQLIVRRTQ